MSQFEGRVAPVEKAVGEAWWALATTGTAEAREELVRAGTEYDALFSDGEEYGKVRGWYGDREALDSPLLRRQVEVLYRTFAGRRGDPGTLRRVQELEAEANAVYGNHRGTVDGKPVGENEIREILRASDDGALRRAAWEASKTVGREVEGIVRELARLRNGLAREQGYADHRHRSLDLQEIDPDELDRLMLELESLPMPPSGSSRRTSTRSSGRGSAARPSCRGTSRTPSSRVASTGRLRHRVRLRRGAREVPQERATARWHQTVPRAPPR